MKIRPEWGEHQKYILYFLLVLLFLGGFFLWHFLEEPPAASPLRHAGASGEASSDKGVVVYIAGAVRQPGVYELSRGSRLHDALKAAGDVLPYGDLASVNLAEAVEDGDKIIIPVLPEREQALPGASLLVNINTAGETELATLPGIGPVTARKIIDFRNSRGPFQTKEALKDVPSIGDGKYEKLKDRITL